MSKTLSGLSILCVDDQPDILLVLSTILTNGGATVTTALSAEIGIKCLTDKKYDVVVSDLSMPPGLDGYDLAHALRKMEREEHRTETPTLCVSGDAMTPSVKRRFADFQVYMLKTVNPARFLDVVKRLAEADGDAVKAGTLGNFENEKLTITRLSEG